MSYFYGNRKYINVLDQTHTFMTNLWKIHFNITFPFMRRTL